MNRIGRNSTALLANIGGVLLVGAAFGCAGVAVVVRGSDDFRVEAPRITARGVLSASHMGARATEEAALRALGKPDEIIELGGDRDRWRYRTGIRLHGVALLFIVIPIPLLVPTGVHQAYVEIENGMIVEVHGSQRADVARFGCMIGPIAELSGDGGCFAGRGASPHSVRLGSGELWLGPQPSLRAAPAIRIR